MTQSFKEQFAQTEIKQASSIQATPIPEGWTPAYVKNWDLKQAGEYNILEVLWVCTDQEIIDLVEREEPTVKQSVFLDLTEEGALVMGEGKNIPLGLLRTALGQNNDGEIWRPDDMVGAQAQIEVFHEMYRDTPIAKVKRAAKLED